MIFLAKSNRMKGIHIAILGFPMIFSNDFYHTLSYSYIFKIFYLAIFKLCVCVLCVLASFCYILFSYQLILFRTCTLFFFIHFTFFLRFYDMYLVLFQLKINYFIHSFIHKASHFLNILTVPSLVVNIPIFYTY